MRISCLASHYPALSHTFVLREIRARRRLGVEVETFSIRKALHRELLAVADREEAEPTYAALSLRPADFLVSDLTALYSRPYQLLHNTGVRRRPGQPGAPRPHLGRVLLRRGDARVA